MERKFLEAVADLVDEGIVFYRRDNEKPLRPTVTVVASIRLKDRDDDVHEFVKQLRDAYPLARIVVGDKSPVEKAAGTAAVLYGMPFQFVEKGKKGEWDDSAIVLDERCVAASTHVVAFDSSARSDSYRKLALRQNKHFSTV